MNSLHHVDGDKYMLADIGTKAVVSSKADPKLGVITGSTAMESSTEAEESG
jgi:hypothetical protein